MVNERRTLQEELQQSSRRGRAVAAVRGPAALVGGMGWGGFVRALEHELVASSQPGAWASLVAHMVKNLPAMLETWVPYLHWEDPLEEGMATHSNILAWRIPVDRGTWRAAVHGVAKSRIRLSD